MSERDRLLIIDEASEVDMERVRQVLAERADAGVLRAPQLAPIEIVNPEAHRPRRRAGMDALLMAAAIGGFGGLAAVGGMLGRSRRDDNPNPRRDPNRGRPQTLAEIRARVVAGGTVDCARRYTHDGPPTWRVGAPIVWCVVERCERDQNPSLFHVVGPCGRWDAACAIKRRRPTCPDCLRALGLG